MNKKFINRRDIWIIAAVIVAAAAVWILFKSTGNEGAKKALIYHGKELLMEVDLSEGMDKTFSLEGYPQVMFTQYANGSIGFSKSDCPDQICVHTGRLSGNGETAACLPNGLILNVVNTNEDRGNLDAVVR